MDEEKAQALIDILESVQNAATADEIVEAFDILIQFAKQIKQFNEEERSVILATVDEAISSAEERLSGANQAEWAKIQQKVSQLKDGRDGRDGKDGQNGIDGKDGLNGSDGIDLFPNTPNQEIEKINEATNQISKERVEGLAEIEEIARANQLPVTTTHFYKNGVHIGRAKNINFESTGSADVTVAGDIGTVKVTYITVSDTAPANPSLNDLWVDTSV